MHVHNVSDYAPEGYRLAASNMERGRCSHVFVAEGKPELRCEGAWASADEEERALKDFRLKHTVRALPDDAPELQNFREHYAKPSADDVVFDAPVEVTPELAAEIGCGLPEMLESGRGQPPSGEPFTVSAVDQESGTITFESRPAKPKAPGKKPSAR